MKAIALLLLALGTLATTRAEATPPNILFILADDLGNGDLGYNGGKEIRTPHLDRLAQQGIILTDAHTTASVCAPSRAGIFSGKYQQRFGFECNSPGRGKGMPNRIVSYADAMKSAGYQTFGLGKWHLGESPDMHPNRQGFDHFSGFLGGGRSYWPTGEPGHAGMLQRNGKQVPEEEIGYLTDWLTDEAIRLLKNRDTSSPFFMYLGYNAPHTPMHAKDSDLAKYPGIQNKNRRIYAAMVDNMDQNIGRLRAFLESSKLADNTMVIFASDNGGATSNASDNGIYRGMKGSKWEGGHRVPCLVFWPAAGISGGKRYDGLVSTLDFMATSLDAAGRADMITALKLDGVSLLPALKQSIREPAHDTLFFRRSVAAAVRDGQWKLIRVEERDKSHRYLLFDLSKDIGETNNLAESHPERIRQLAAKLGSWEQPLAPAQWTEGDYWENNQRLKHRMSVIGRDAERKLP